MNQPLSPTVDDLIYDGYYPGDTPGDPTTRQELDEGKLIFEARNKKIELKNEPGGYAHNPKIIMDWLDNSASDNIKFIAVYFGVDDKNCTNLMIAGSAEGYKDMVPLDDMDKRYSLYDNGNQCCKG